MNMLDRICEYAFGSERRRIRFLCMYVVMFLACLICVVHAAYRAVSCFPGARFWADVVFTVWLGILAFVTYVSLLALSECFTRDQERAWRERGYE